MTRPPTARVCLRALSVVSVLALGGVVVLAPAAQASALDGSFSGATVNDIQPDSLINVIANVFANVLGNQVKNDRAAPASADSCTLTIRAVDPDGASGSTTVAVPDGASRTKVSIPDTNPAVRYAAGDTDHFTGTIVCTDTTTGEVAGMLDISSDLVAH